MRVALITYHYGYNEGTLLQAHATQRLLEEAFPDATVELIDWRYPKKEAVAFSQPRNGRERELRAFFEESLRLSEQTFRMSPPTAAFDYVRQHCDLVVVGSDELWRLDYEERGPWPFRYRVQKNPWAPPFPNVYWPDAGELGLPCASLASSVGEMDLIEAIPTRHRTRMATVLQNLSLLTVRDSRTEAFVEDVLPGASSRCMWLPDPTFALGAPDSNACSSVESFFRDAGVSRDSRVALVISTVPNPALNELIRFFKSAGYTLVGLSHSLEGIDVDLSSQPLGPLEWAAASACADVVLTDRFHGAVFALKNATPVIAVDHRPQLSGRQSKIEDLFDRFGIGDCSFSLSSLPPLDLDRLEEVASRIVAGDWPTQRVRATCHAYSTRLREFVSGPLKTLVDQVAA